MKGALGSGAIPDDQIEQFRREVPGYMLRHKVKPGITGIWQTSGRHEVGFTDWTHAISGTRTPNS